ncbi:MAG: efflux RND transporter periplasmic adaptor subunit [Desulfosporosinus sp.]
MQKQDYVPSLLLSGEVIPESSIDLSAQTSGTVLKINVQKGQQVKKGEILLQLDDRQARLALDQAKGAVEIARINLQKAETAQNQEDAQLRSIELDLAAEQAQTYFERAQALAQAGAISQQELEQASHNLKLAQERARSAKVTLDTIQNSDRLNLTLLQKELQQRELELKNKELLLEQHKVIAPSDGQVLELFVVQGELVQTNGKVATISSSQCTRVCIKPDQRYADLAALDNQAEVWLPTVETTKWPAKVVYTEPAGNSEQGSLTAELSLEENIPELYPGRLVSVQLFGASVNQAIIVAEEYLTVQQDQSGVWVAESGFAHFRPVQTGLRTPAGVVILSGINEGDLVLKPMNLKEGQKVAPQPKGLDDNA